MPRATLIQLRRGTAAEWTSANPILASGEAGYETDTGYLKYGDGSTPWNALDYFVTAGATPDPDTTLLGNPITAQELDYLSGVTSNVQTQLNAKAASSHAHVISDTTGLQTALDAKATAASVSSIESDVSSIQDDLSDAVGTGELVREGAIPTPVAIVVTDAPYNVTGDARELRDGNITASSATLTSASAGFTSDDVGKVVVIYAAGAAGGIGATTSGGSTRKALITTISAVVNAMTATLASTATNSVTSGRFVYGTDDTEAIQAALDDLETHAGGRVVFPAGRRYLITATLNIPRFSRLNDPQHQYSAVVVSGYGAHIQIAGTTVSVFEVAPLVSLIDDITKRFTVEPTIEGFTIEGTALTTQKGVDVSSTFGATIRDLRIANIGIGVHLRFAISGRVERVTVDNATLQCFLIASADTQITGDSALLTPTNATVLDGCRALPNGIAASAYSFLNCDQVELRNSIEEKYPDDANTPAYSIYIDYQGIGYEHGVTIRDFYCETTSPTSALIRVINNGYVVLEKIRRYTSVGVLVDATGSVESSIVCRDWTITNGDASAANSWIKFKQNAADTVGWTFENMGEIARGETTNLVTNSALWIGGVIPTRVTQIEPGRIASAP